METSQPAGFLLQTLKSSKDSCFFFLFWIAFCLLVAVCLFVCLFVLCVVGGDGVNMLLAPQFATDNSKTRV